MPKLDQDQWCPNCRQMVRPKIVVGGDAKTTALTAYVAIVAFAWFTGQLQFWLVAGAVLAIAVGAFIVATSDVQRSCPICKTEGLREEAPIV